jgi:lipopolysaccharide/colanic/teichoic acid biosynthesis glycosyltransferase
MSPLKRLLDLVGSVAGLVLLSPLLLLVAMVVRARLGSPVLFVQERPGQHERPFRMVKFRTMREPRAGEERALSDGARLTRTGLLLRRLSLDELPELWNVLKGDMSLVGPRPLLMSYLPYFTDRERLRFQVRPGITGLAQVSGRNHASWDDRLAADVEYVERWSLRLDLWILARTVVALMQPHAVVPDARSVMLNFDEERRIQGERREEPSRRGRRQEDLARGHRGGTA